MFAAQHHSHLPSAWPLRLLALACVVLVGLLSLATVSPEIHTTLHGRPQELGEHAEHRGHPENQAEAEHSCAVTLLSQGFESGCTHLLVLGAPEPLLTDVIGLADEVARAARAVQLPPGRGPPIG